MNGDLSYRQTAKILDVDHRAMAGIVKALGIKPGVSKFNGKAKTLTPSQVALIKRRLRPLTISQTGAAS